MNCKHETSDGFCKMLSDETVKQPCCEGPCDHYKPDIKENNITQIEPCKYRVSDGEDENGNPCDLCLKDVANGDEDPEPCDYCNTDFEV